MSEVKNEENYSILDLLNKYHFMKKHNENTATKDNAQKSFSNQHGLNDDVTENYILGYN